MKPRQPKTPLLKWPPKVIGRDYGCFYITLFQLDDKVGAAQKTSVSQERKPPSPAPATGDGGGETWEDAEWEASEAAS